MTEQLLTHYETETREVTRALEINLQPHEFAQLGKEAADIAADINSTEDEFKKIKTEWSGRLSEKRNHLDETLESIRHGKKTEQVECVLELNYQANSVTTRRKDTGEMVEERAMTFEERQKTMEFKEADEIHDAEEDEEPLDEEGKRQDIAETILEEMKATKPSLVN